VISANSDMLCICAFEILLLEENTHIHNMLDLRIERRKKILCVL
jgi:hypothetical protein